MNAIQKAIAITDAKISFVSLVDKAANKKQFLITKAENGQADFCSYGKILKTDNDTHYVTGIVYEPMTEDAHKNFMTEGEIAKACHWFQKNGNQNDVQHSFEKAEGISVVENYVAPCEMTIGEEKIAKGTWIMTTEVNNDDVWDKIQKGEITGYSMGGVGNYSEEDVDLDNVKKSAPITIEKNSEMKGVFKKLASFFGFETVEKGAFKDRYNAQIKNSNFWTAFDVLRNTLSSFDNFQSIQVFEKDETKIRDALSEFNEVVIQLLAEDSIAKSLYQTQITKKEEEKDDMNREEVQEMIEETIKKSLEPVLKQLQPVLKQDDNNSPAGTQEKEPQAEPALTAEQIGEMIEKSVSKAVEPLLKARGIATNLNADGEMIEKNDEPQHYLHGIL